MYNGIENMVNNHILRIKNPVPGKPKTLGGDFMAKDKNKNSEEYKLYKEKVLKHENPVIEDIKDDMSQPVKGLPKARG